MLCEYFCLLHRQMLLSAFIREASFCSQRCRVKELGEMEKFKNWWLGEGSEMLYSEHDIAIAFMNSQHLLRNRGRAHDLTPWRVTPYDRCWGREALISNSSATGMFPSSRVLLHMHKCVSDADYNSSMTWIRKWATYSKKVKRHRGGKRCARSVLRGAHIKPLRSWVWLYRPSLTAHKIQREVDLSSSSVWFYIVSSRPARTT